MAPTETNACYCDKGNASGEELHDLFCNGEEGVIFLEEREERREGGGKGGRRDLEREERREGGGKGERKGKGKREEVKEEGGREAHLCWKGWKTCWRHQSWDAPLNS